MATEVAYKAGGGYRHATYQADSGGESVTLLFFNREPLILRSRDDVERVVRDLSSALHRWPDPRHVSSAPYSAAELGLEPQ